MYPSVRAAGTRARAKARGRASTTGAFARFPREGKPECTHGRVSQSVGRVSQSAHTHLGNDGRLRRDVALMKRKVVVSDAECRGSVAQRGAAPRVANVIGDIGTASHEREHCEGHSRGARPQGRRRSQRDASEPDSTAFRGPSLDNERHPIERAGRHVGVRACRRRVHLGLRPRQVIEQLEPRPVSEVAQLAKRPLLGSIGLPLDRGSAVLVAVAPRATTRLYAAAPSQRRRMPCSHENGDAVVIERGLESIQGGLCRRGGRVRPVAA